MQECTGVPFSTESIDQIVEEAQYVWETHLYYTPTVAVFFSYPHFLMKIAFCHSNKNGLNIFHKRTLGKKPLQNLLIKVV